MADNFSCLSSNLSHDSFTEEAWMLPPEATRSGVIAISTVLVVFMVVGIPWNIAVLAVLIYKKFYKQPSTFLLFNLAVVDLLTCTLVMPFQAAPGLAGGVYNLGGSDYRRCQSCYAGVLLVIGLLFISVHVTAIMAVDRLIYVKKSMTYDKVVTIPRVAVAVGVAWLIGFVAAILPLFQFGAVHFRVTVGTCSVAYEVDTQFGKSYFYIFFLVLEVMIPLGVLVVANVWLLCIARKTLLRRTRRSMRGEDSEESRKARGAYNQQQIQLLKVFGAIFIFNFVTWGPPILVIMGVVGAVGTENIPAGIFGLIYVSFLSQSVIHPILESFLAHSIRVLVKKLCCSCYKVENHSSASTRTKSSVS